MMASSLLDAIAWLRYRRTTAKLAGLVAVEKHLRERRAKLSIFKLAISIH
jgi:hypothetical protein